MKSEDLLKEYRDAELRRGLTPYTVKRRRREIERFFEAVGTSVKLGDRVAEITGNDVGEYLAGLVSGRAYNDALRALKSFYGYLVKRDLLLADPCAGMEYRPVTPIRTGCVFTKREIAKLLESCTGNDLLDLRDRAVMTLLYATALRLSELAGLAIRDVDLRRCELFLRRGKGGKERRVPLGRTAAEVLDAYLETRLRLRVNDQETLFLSARGQAFTAAGIEKMLARRKKRAGITSPGLAHAFRHACATHMLSAGAPLPLIRRMLGHARIETTARYTHVMKERLAKVHASAHPKAKEAE